MYVQQSKACDMPNSETPMSAAAIARQDAFVAAIGKKFTDGNQAMADVIARLTPPPPTGTCNDFTTSDSMSNITPFPWPVPLGNPAAPGGAAGGGAAASAPADSLSQVSGGWVWANPGGGSTYPWGPTQLAASRLVPPWACRGAGAPGLADGPMSLDTALTIGKWLAIAFGAGLVITAGMRSRR